MKSSVLITILVLGILIIGGVAYFNSQSSSQVPSVTDNNGQNLIGGGPALNSPTPEVKTFNVSAGNFEFSLKEIKVNKGDTVKVNLSNNEGFHDFVIDEYNLNTEVVPAGQTTTVEFVADQEGTFEYYCSVGNHRQMGMVGKLIVEE